MLQLSREGASLRTPLLHHDALATQEKQNLDAALNVEMFTMQYKKFKKNVLKTQQRAAGQSMQRIKKQDSEVEIEIEMLTFAQVADIKVWVKRMIEIESPPVGFVELEVKKDNLAFNKYDLVIDLNSVFEKDGKQVYSLSKSYTEERNQFFLRIEVLYVDGCKSAQHTEPFKIIGKVKEAKGLPRRGEHDEENQFNKVSYQPLLIQHDYGKKRKLDQFMTTMQEGPYSTALDSLSDEDPFASQTCTPLDRDQLIEASKIISDEIKAKTAFIEELNGIKQIQTSRGDIAYHFALCDPSEVESFQEGEIVGIFEGPGKEAVLDKISTRNARKAIARGVITRSHYIAANLPDNGTTETVCMFGVVPVRVEGSVMSGEPLYCSHVKPGLAVSGRRLRSSNATDDALIGIALETSAALHDEVHLVDSLISLTMEVFGNIMDKRIKRLRQNVVSEVDSIRNARRRLHKRLCACLAIAVVFGSLLAVLLWQLLAPCSAYKYWRCKQGMVAKQEASFWYRQLSSAYQEINVTGIEFTWKNLIKKTDFGPGQKKINGTGFHYYLNLDVCACGEKARGPSGFATDVSCTHAYFYSSSCKKWCRYYSATKLVCHPFYPWGSMTTLVKEKLCWVTASLKWYCLT